LQHQKLRFPSCSPVVELIIMSKKHLPCDITQREIGDLTPTMQSNGDFAHIFFNFAILTLLFTYEIPVYPSFYLR
jgi:hypothetical protein